MRLAEALQGIKSDKNIHRANVCFGWITDIYGDEERPLRRKRAAGLERH